MAALQPSAPGEQPPPDLPNMPDVSETLSRYLRTFSLWCRNGFRDKLTISASLPGVLIQATDRNVPNPAVYRLDVTTPGVATLSPVALGTGKVGAPVPIGQGYYLPYTGGTITGALTVSGALTASGALNVGGAAGFSGPLTANNSVVIYSLTGTIGQAGGSSFMVQTVGGQPMIAFHIPGVFACNFGMDSGGNFYSGGWSFGVNNFYKFWTSRDFANPCDYRSKENVQPLGSTWDVVKALKPVSYTNKDFDWVKADGLERWGFIAHELQETLVESAATGVKDEPDRVQSPNMLVVIAALTKTVQELQARVEAIEGRGR
jgi:hypothetical protein